MLYLNGFVWPYKDAAVVVAAALDIAAIGWGITFVIRIIDPDKYTNAAKRLIAEETQGMETAGQQEDAEDFFALFDRLEAAMRQALEQAGVPEPARDRGRDGLSTFRAMLLALFQHNLIDRSLFRELMGIGRYRNLATYGRVRRVDTAIIDQTRTALARMEALSLPARRAPA